MLVHKRKKLIPRVWFHIDSVCNEAAVWYNEGMSKSGRMLSLALSHQEQEVVILTLADALVHCLGACKIP